MRVAHVNLARRPPHILMLDGHLVGLNPDCSHSHGHITVVMQFDVTHPSARRDVSLSSRHAPSLDEIACEDTQTVATHFSDRAISVAIIHEPQVRIAIPVLNISGSQSLQGTVGPDPESAMAQPTHLRGSQRVLLVDDDEVIAGTVSFPEGRHSVNPPRRSSGRSTPSPQPGHQGLGRGH